MQVVITGAGGFVGRHLVQSLLADGHQVTASDLTVSSIADGARKVEGDICERDVRAKLLEQGCDALVHMATVPGGAAEADPAASFRVNVQAMAALLDDVAVAADCPRVVYASSIAVLGDAMPPEGVSDATPLSPAMIYGGHKAMMEPLVATLSNRGAIDGVTIRLPGILARPMGAKGIKSAFMSEIFHALRAGEAFTCPVSPGGTIWAESLTRCVANFRHAIVLDSALMPPTRAVTLPALQIRMEEMVEAIVSQCGVAPDLVRYEPDEYLQRTFGTYPPLETAAAHHAGFEHDGNVSDFVAAALKTL